MSVPDFKQPLLFEIQIAREIIGQTHAMIPFSPTGDKRRDLAHVLVHIAVEHSMSICALFEVGAMSSGYALMRSALETVYKAVWIATVAKDSDVVRAWKGNDAYGDFKRIIAQIEKQHAATGLDKLFAKIKPHMRALHENTHSGAQQTRRRLAVDDMRFPEYDFGVLIRDIRTLVGAVMLAASPIITPEQRNALQTSLREKHSWLVTTSAATI